MTRPFLCRTICAVQQHIFRRNISVWKSIKRGIKNGRDILDLHPTGTLYPKPKTINIELWPYIQNGEHHAPKQMTLLQYLY